MATAVYILCFATSAACGWLLVRSYLRTRTALLLWTAICFVLLALNNFLVVADLVLLPAVDLRVEREQVRQARKTAGAAVAGRGTQA